MHPQERRERVFKISKIIIDYYGQSWFRGRKVLDLGSGDGELGNVFAKLGATVTCCDAREENLASIRKKFPHIETIKADLEKEFPFQDLSFDLVISIDVLCHLKNYQFNLQNMLNVSESIVLETEVMDSPDVTGLTIIQEARHLSELSFSGEGSIPSAAGLQQRLGELGAKFKRIDETKLNDADHRYDWKPIGTGRRAGNRRFYFIRKDQHEARMVRHRQIQEEQRLEQERLKNSSQKTRLNFGDYSNPGSIYTDIPDFKSKEKKFVIVIPSYKNESWCERNLLSALNQNFSRFRILYVDDCSPDKTYEKVIEIADNHPNGNKCIIRKNARRVGAMQNLYEMIHSCDDDEIIVTLDGDDWLADDTVLMRLQNYYNTNDIWMLNTQHTNSTGGLGCSSSYPPSVVANRSYRADAWRASHLRSFYAWLFKKIKKEDLMKDGQFYAMTYDMAMCYPMLDMAAEHQKFTSEVMYIYNLGSDINDHKVNRALQAQLDGEIRAKPRYPKIVPVPKNLEDLKIGILLIATGKYDQFLQQFLDSADQFFLPFCKNVTYHIFTDSKVKLKSKRKVEILPIDHRPFPHASMDRFAHFVEHKDSLEKEDYLYYCDVDSRIVSLIGEEILGQLVGVHHCGYYGTKGPWEDNPASALHTDINRYSCYYGGGFSGGTSKNYLALSEWCKKMTEKDLANGVVPKFHDESVLNRYFLDHPPLVLSPSYHYPESNPDHYKRIWKGNNFIPKILLLDKNHSEVRA